MEDRNSTTNNRLMLLTSALLDVSIHVQPQSDENFNLQGQVLPLLGIDPELCSIELISEEGQKWMAETDNLGFFEIKDLSTRTAYRLIVTGHGFEVTMRKRIWCDLESAA